MNKLFPQRGQPHWHKPPACDDLGDLAASPMFRVGRKVHLTVFYRIVLSLRVSVFALAGMLAGLCNAQEDDAKQAPIEIKGVVHKAVDGKGTYSADRSTAKDAQRRFKYEKRGAIEYSKGDDFRLTCDMYVPESSAPRPVVIAIHGGAWRQGSKLTMLRHAMLLAKRGYVVMAINYRHAPEHKFPAQIHDCKHAVRWVRHHAEEYNVDPKNVIIYGYSAGGHLACLLGTTDEDDGLEGEPDEALQRYDTQVAAVIAGGSPCEFSWVSDRSRNLAYWLGSSRNQNPEIYRLASPLSFVTADDPPFYIYHGTSDWLVPLESPQKFTNALKEAGVSFKFETDSGNGHVLTFSDTAWLVKGIEFVEEALNLDPSIDDLEKPNLEKSKQK